MLDPSPPRADRPYLKAASTRLDEPGVFGRLILWIKLSSGRIPGFRFVHDHPIAGYTVDFYCPDVKLAIDVEPDESSRRVTDEKRVAMLEAHGVMLVTFAEKEVREYIDDVLEHIEILATAFDRIHRSNGDRS